MDSCIFCNIGPERIVEKNEWFFAIHDRYPVTALHTLLIPFRHAESYFELTQLEVEGSQVLLHSQRQSILEADQAVSGFNIGINVGRAAGQTVMHCHIHLIPRRSEDVLDPTGGVRGVIPEKQKY